MAAAPRIAFSRAFLSAPLTPSSESSSTGARVSMIAISRGSAPTGEAVSTSPTRTAARTVTDPNPRSTHPGQFVIAHLPRATERPEFALRSFCAQTIYLRASDLRTQAMCHASTPCMVHRDVSGARVRTTGRRTLFPESVLDGSRLLFPRAPHSIGAATTFPAASRVQSTECAGLARHLPAGGSSGSRFTRTRHAQGTQGD